MRDIMSLLHDIVSFWGWKEERKEDIKNSLAAPDAGQCCTPRLGSANELNVCMWAIDAF